MKPNLSVVVTRYSESDLMVLDCLTTLSLQIDATIEVLFLDQKVSRDLKIKISQLNTKNIIIKYISIPAKSLSFARNYGIKHAASNLIAFCDADCLLPVSWASTIVATFKKYHPAILGSKIIPQWSKKPSWYHSSSLIREFYSLIDLGSKNFPISKVVGASFALNKTKVGQNAYFDENLGRRAGVLLGGEETDLCSRVIAAGGVVFYTPDTFAYHRVDASRQKLSWLLKRAYFGGFSRSLRGGSPQPFNRTLKLVDYFALSIIYPMYIFGLIKGRLHGTH